MHNIQAEQILLGAILSNHRQTEKVLSYMKPEHFYEPVHQRIFQVISGELASGRSASPVLLKNHFEKDGSLKEVGGTEYLQRLAGLAGLVLHLPDYAEAVYDLAKKRDLIELCDRLKADTLTETEKPADEILNTANRQILELSHNPLKSNIKSSRHVSLEIYETLKETSPRYSTGIKALDLSMQGGLYTKKSYGIAARKKQGKTLLAATISHNLNHAGVKHLFICAEMGQHEIQQRNIARSIRCNALSFINEERDSIDFLEKVSYYAVRKDPGNALYLDAPGISFDELRRQLSYAVMHHHIKGFILDYWQLVGGKPARISTAEHLDEVAQWIANFCRAHHLFSIVTAQLNQEENTRGSEGIRLAFDQVYHLQRHQYTDDVWLEMLDTRYTAWLDVGDKDNPQIKMNHIGPYFSDMD